MNERWDEEQEQIASDSLYRRLVGQAEYDLEQSEKGDDDEDISN